MIVSIVSTVSIRTQVLKSIFGALLCVKTLNFS